MNLDRVLSLTPHFSGSLSIIGSSAIIYMVLSDRENKLLIPKHRLMLAMSVYDVFQSFALAMSTLPYPKEYFDVYSYGAIGNMTTCKIQYFFVALGLAVPMYNASLCLLYYLTIRHRWRPIHFGTKIEPFIHAGACLIPLVTAIGPIVLDNVAPTSRYCAVSAVAPNKSTFVLVIATTIPALSFLICVYTMTSISIFVHLQWKKMSKYTYNATQIQRQMSEKWKTIRQAMLYTAAFVLTFLFPCICILTQSFPFSLELLSNIFYPLQGFWNFLLYIRPSLIRMKKTKPDKYLWEIIWLVIFRSKIEKKLNNKSRISTPGKRKRGMKTGDENYRKKSNRSKNPHSGQVKIEMRTGNELNLNEISGDSPRLSINSLSPLSIASNNYTKGSSPVFHQSNCDLIEGDLRLEPRSDDEGNGQYMVQRRSSAVFATVIDDIFVNSFDSMQSFEDDISED